MADSGYLSRCLDEKKNTHSPNCSSDEDDEEENQRSSSDSAGNNTDDSDELIGKWKRRKGVDVHTNQKKVRYPCSPSDADSDEEKENDPPRNQAFSPSCENVQCSAESSSSVFTKHIEEKENARNQAFSPSCENVQCSAASSSSVHTKHIEEKENARRDEKTDLYDVSFQNYPSLGTIGIESAGKETIFDMVTNRFRTFGVKNCKPQFENMVFLNANKDCLNIGLPVGVLSTTKAYTCVFKKNLVFHPSDFKRRYAVHDYNINWKLGHFFVSFSPISREISQFSTIVHTRMQVDFFDNETLFESLMRDGRFNEEELRCCVVKQGRTPLSYKAKHFQGKCVEIHNFKKEKDTKLPESVLPQLHPDPFINTSTVTPSKVKQESTSGVSSSSLISLTPLDASTPRPTSMPVESRKNSGQWIELTFNVSCKELKVKNVGKLGKQLKEFENFAQEQGLRYYARELKELAEILQSVGAIFLLDIAKQPRLVGTCFRIGTVYILTNNHVSEEIVNSQVEENEKFVDFNFEEAGESHSERRSIGELVVNCEELDYAIFSMNEPPEKLPRCIFSHGISIMDPEKGDWRMLGGKPVRLIGHPQSEPKQVDLKCIVDARPQSGLECYAYTVRRGEQFEGEAAKDYREINDRRRGTYQSSDFFHGSSGSPGLVLLNNRKWLVFLHTRGFKTSRNKFYIEQGVLVTEIFKDVRKKFEQARRDSSCGDNPLNDISLEDLFPSVDGVTQASRGEPMEH